MEDKINVEVIKVGTDTEVSATTTEGHVFAHVFETEPNDKDIQDYFLEIESDEKVKFVRGNSNG